MDNHADNIGMRAERRAINIKIQYEDGTEKDIEKRYGGCI